MNKNTLADLTSDTVNSFASQSIMSKLKPISPPPKNCVTRFYRLNDLSLIRLRATTGLKCSQINGQMEKIPCTCSLTPQSARFIYRAYFTHKKNLPSALHLNAALAKPWYSDNNNVRNNSLKL